ncbi:NAD(P)-binding domain-containing protein [Spirochaetia bacterium 38H-sp]|uniref:Glutamyl-tRNA reductase n=1 Tax=Rarispira pelagica TaxID=3141764 RepID=A0ABU9U9S9_9SPIR
MIVLRSFHLLRDGRDTLSSLYISPQRQDEFIKSIFADEVLLLQTCNRWELLQINSHKDIDFLPGGGLELYDYDAFLHLARVCAGLDSAIPGDTEIVHQVKQSFLLSERLGKAGPVLKNIFPKIMHISKKIRSSYRISEGYRSIAGLSAFYLMKRRTDRNIKNIAILGAGAMAAKFASYTSDMDLDISIIANRTIDKARVLAQKYNAEVLNYKELSKYICCMDVLFCATSAPHPIITKDLYEDILERLDKKLVIIDVAIPPDVDKALYSNKNVDYLDINRLARWQASIFSQRIKYKNEAEKDIKELANECYKKIKAWYKRKQISCFTGSRMDTTF